MDNTTVPGDGAGLPVRVVRWGNSLGVRIPASLVRETAIREGDWLAMTTDPQGNLGLRRVVAEEFDRAGFVSETSDLRSGAVSQSIVEELRVGERF